MFLTDPWPHIVIDNFLSEKDLRYFTWLAGEMEKRYQASGSTDGHYRHWFKHDILSEYNMMQYFEQFEYKMPYESLQTQVGLIRFMPNNYYPIHCDAHYKIMSTVIYITPEENLGTRMFREQDESTLVKENTWKPNKAFMFCNYQGYTWHDYASSDKPRYTLMHNLVSEECTHSNVTQY